MVPERFTYLLLLLGWALPLIAVHWIVGAPELRARLRLLAVAVTVPTIYLTAADALAIGAGIWSISDQLTLGWRAGSLVFEEALFFFLTNVLVAQSVVLFLAPSARRRARVILVRWLHTMTRGRSAISTDGSGTADQSGT